MRAEMLAVLVGFTVVGCSSTTEPFAAVPPPASLAPVGSVAVTGADDETGTTEPTAVHVESTEPPITAAASPSPPAALDPDLQPVWYQSAFNLLAADYAYPGSDTLAVAAQSHAVVAGRVKAVEPGLIIQFPGTGVPPTAFVNVVIETERSWASREDLSLSTEITISLLADYSGTQVVADVLDSAKIDPSTVDDFPEEELGDVEFTYDYDLIEQAYTTRIDDAINELLEGQDQFLGAEVVAFVRSYDVDLAELRQRAATDQTAAEALTGWPDRPSGEVYLTNPLAILTADASTGKMRSIEDGAFQELSGRDFGQATAALASALSDTYRETPTR